MKRFREYITESSEKEMLKIFNPVIKIIDIFNYESGAESEIENKLMGGTVEDWVGGIINLKSGSRQDILKDQIPAPLAKKYGIVTTNNINREMAENILKFQKDNPYGYFNWRFSLYPDLINISKLYKKLRNHGANKQLILWALKIKKADIINVFLNNVVTIFDDNSKEFKKFKKIYFDLGLDSQTEENFKSITKYGYIAKEDAMHTLFHYLSLNIPEINNYNPRRKSWSAVMEDFQEIEDEWKNKDHSSDITNLDGITEIIRFEDGTAWFNLNKEYCTIEGDAMRHCGNSASWEEGDRVISLRSIGKSSHKPLLTFVVHKDGSLGEAKAKANSKPPQKYHDHIIKLLTLTNPNGDWFIKRIVGGKYLTGNDFKVDDLSKDDMVKLQSVRPDLFE